MAVTKIIPTKIPLSAEVEIPAFTAVAVPAEGAYIDFTDVDLKTFIMVKNSGSAAKTVTIKAGDSAQAAGDYVFSVDAGKTVGLSLESGRYKNLYGTAKGQLHFIAESADIQLAAVILP